MDREIDMKEVSDGKLYGLRDMVKADCGGCEGCSDCCRGMGTSSGRRKDRAESGRGNRPAKSENGRSKGAVWLPEFRGPL